MKKRIIIPLILVLLIAGGAGGYYLYNKNTYQETLENATSLLSEQQENIESVQSELESFDEGSYLREGLTEEDIQAVEDKMEAIKDLSSEFDLKENDLEEDVAEIASDKEDLKEKLSAIRAQLETQQSVNDLFEQETPAINGSEINEDVIIKEDLETSTLEDLKETAFIEDEDISEWQTAINTFITDAENQLSTTATATAQVETLFKDGEVQGEVTLEAYDEAKSEVDKIQNETVKETLTADLDSAHAHIQDISMLSDEEIARRALALFVDLYWEVNENTFATLEYIWGGYQFDADGGAGSFSSMNMPGNAKPICSYTIDKNGDVLFKDIPDLVTDCSSEPKTANIFTDVDETILNNIRGDVSMQGDSVIDEMTQEEWEWLSDEEKEKWDGKWENYRKQYVENWGKPFEEINSDEIIEDENSEVEEYEPDEMPSLEDDEIQEYEPDKMPALDEDEEEFFEG
ncbi:hypothetical protein BN997_00531 [Oceanobacillus oncorhynchi]|uniref:Uncharacterized protein n=1 Tax=Oceanobacillus oncorhynchi TaxID=545501 RepID=A0A0A1MM18_9BACI|nr:hypothetical protein [Oceanobacillus oncorhynchi]CEI80722.1 hypothetical protein BN997_00531 [Oceanobacillus oncorhynchi]